jgi:hypothetical protein
MIYDYTSSKAIIAKTFRDLKIQRNDWIKDAVEWIGEALQAINAAPQFEDKARVIKTQSHRAPLPRDLYRLKEVRYGLENSNKTEKPDRDAFSIVLQYGDSSNHPSLVEESKNVDKGANQAEETFILDSHYIKTSFEEDWILVTYLGFALDDDNFPMVPDNYSYKQALYWYIVMKLMEGGKDHPAGLGWGDAEQRWLKYCTQARNQANMPDESKYEQFFESWVTMVPHLNYRTETSQSSMTSYEQDQTGEYSNFFVDLD